MTAPITIVVTGQPVPKGRPRMTKAGIAFTPAKTRKWESDARLLARQRMFGEPCIEGPVIVTVIAQYQPPASWPAWKREAALRGDIGMTGRPDVDNLGKAAVDALNEIVFRDDSQIVQMSLIKRYAPEALVSITVHPTGQHTPHAKRADIEEQAA